MGGAIASEVVARSGSSALRGRTTVLRAVGGLVALLAAFWSISAHAATTVRFPFSLTPETTFESLNKFTWGCVEPPSYRGFMRLCKFDQQGKRRSGANVGFARVGESWKLAQVQLVERTTPSAAGSIIHRTKRNYGIDKHTVDREGEILFDLDDQDDWLLTASPDENGTILRVQFYFVPLMKVALGQAGVTLE